MESDTATIVAIASVLVAGLALLWGVYTHLSTRRIAKLTYEVSQLSDFGVPSSFLHGIDQAPLAITVTSRGNKGTENIFLRMRTASQIENYEVNPRDVAVTKVGNELTLKTDRLNPSQQIKLFLRCTGSPNENQIEELELSHVEGRGLNESEIQKISFSFAGVEFEYDLRDLTAHLIKIGPIAFRR